MDWTEKYIAYERKWSDSFAGDCVDTVVVSLQTGNVLGHLRGWKDGSVVDEWHPKRNGLYGKVWDKVRPKGWRKVHNQTMALDWALDALSSW